MRAIEEFKITNNFNLYTKLYRIVETNKGKLNCPYCPFNDRENWNHRGGKSWKNYRYQQYKIDGRNNDFKTSFKYWSNYTD